MERWLWDSMHSPRGFLGTTYIDFNSNKDAIVSDIQRVLLPSDIENSLTPLKVQQLQSTNIHVHRPDLESHITSIIHWKESAEQYLYGP
jgi:hypothetical protein